MLQLTKEIKAIVIGAGMAGLNAAVLLPRKVLNLDLKVYEKNGDIVSLFALHRSVHKD